MLSSRFLKPIFTPVLSVLGFLRLPRVVRRHPWTSLACLGGLGLFSMGAWEMAQPTDGHYLRETLADYESEEFFGALHKLQAVTAGQPSSVSKPAASRRPHESAGWPPVTVPAPNPPALEQSLEPEPRQKDDSQSSADAADAADSAAVRTVGFESAPTGVSAQVTPLRTRTAELPPPMAAATAAAGTVVASTDAAETPPAATAARTLPPPGQAAWFVGTIELETDTTDGPHSPSLSETLGENPVDP